MSFHVYDGRRVIYETLDDARSHAQAAIDECRKQATLYEWPEMVSEIAVYEAPDDCDEPWRDGALVLEARERVVEDEDHLLGKFSEFDLVEVSPVSDPAPETVEVWSSDPALNGTTLVVSTPIKPGDSFELVVANLLPDDDDGDGDEEPGAMCKRALAKAEASGDLIRKVAILVSGAEDEADFERTYGHEDQASIRATAREIIELVRGSSAEGPLPVLGATKAMGGEVVS